MMASPPGQYLQKSLMMARPAGIAIGPVKPPSSAEGTLFSLPSLRLVFRAACERALWVGTRDHGMRRRRAPHRCLLWCCLMRAFARFAPSRRMPPLIAPRTRCATVANSVVGWGPVTKVCAAVARRTVASCGAVSCVPSLVSRRPVACHLSSPHALGAQRLPTVSLGGDP